MRPNTLLVAITSLFVLSSPAPARKLWVAGEDYIAYWDGHSSPVTLQRVQPLSSGVDAASCRLWIADGTSGKLRSFVPPGKPEVTLDAASAVLSDFHEGRFLTRGPDATLQSRDRFGKPLQAFQTPWASFTLSTVPAEKAAIWALNKEGQRLWATRWDPETGQTRDLAFTGESSEWGEDRLTYDAEHGDLWVAFTHAPPFGPGVPMAQRWNAEGKKLTEVSWKQTGRVYDLCLDADRHALLARDMPSDDGFTVPLFSFLEEIGENGQTETRYRAEDDLFLDALHCEPDRIYLATRSIFGSAGASLVEWDRKAGETGRVLSALPGRALKLFACDGD